MAPQGTPDEIMKTLREAYQRMSQDPEFKKQGTKFFGEAWNTVSGERMERAIREATTISPEAQEFLYNIRKKYGLPTGG